MSSSLLPLLSFGIAGASALGGAIGSAANTKKQRDEESRMFRNSKNVLNSEYYRDPTKAIGNRAILKLAEEARRDRQDALDNRMAAGGATMENRLAAKQADNEVESRMYSTLLQGEDARRQALKAQELQLAQQHSMNLQNSYLQNAQNWQNWGATMGNAAMSLGTASMLGNMEGIDTRTLLGLPKK